MSGARRRGLGGRDCCGNIRCARCKDIPRHFPRGDGLADLAFAGAQDFDPGLMLFALLAHRSRQLRQFRHFPAHFFLDNFALRDVR